MLGASLAFGLMAICLKLASTRGVPLGQLMFYRGAVSALVSWIILRGAHTAIASPHWRIHLRRSIQGLMGMAALFYAIGQLPVATAVTLNYTSPLWLGLILTLFHREQGLRLLLSVTAVGFIGVGLLLRPTLDGANTFPVVIALASGISAALAALNMRAIGRLNEVPMRTVFYFGMFISIASLPGFLASDPLAITAGGAFFVVSAALLATLGQWMFTLAYQHGHTQLMSLLGYSQVIFTSVAGIFLFDDRLSLMSWLGMLVIVLSGAVATVLVRQRGPIPADS